MAYAIFYFIYFSFVAAEIVFFPIYFQHLGFSGFEIAVVTALSNLSTVVGPGLALKLTHIPSRQLAMRFLGAAVLLFLPLFFVKTFTLFAFVWFLAVTCHRAPVVLIDTIAIHEAMEGRINFGKIRLWGSVGFVVAAFLIGVVVDRVGSSSILFLGFCCFLGTFSSGFLVRYKLSSEPEVQRQLFLGKGEFFSLFRQSAQLRYFFLAVFFLWMSLGAPYVYLSLYLKSLGLSASMVSVAWNIGVIAEIILMIYFDRLVKRYSLLALFRVSLVLTILRWLLLAFVQEPLVIIFSQILHAFTFASFHLSSMKLVYLMLPENYRPRSQGVLSILGPGCGLIIGRLLVGGASDWLGLEPRSLFFLSGIMTIGAYFCARRIASLKP